MSRTHRPTTVGAVVGGLAMLGLGVAAVPASATGGPSTKVVVIARAGSLAAAEGAVRGAGGTVTRELGVIGGFAATVPAGAVAQVRLSPAVASVTDDRSMTPMSTSTLGYDAAADSGSLGLIAKVTGADQMWAKGYIGQGVDVALIDTGIARVPGLTTTGKVIDGPDLSFDSQTELLAHKDSFGHGTHMAGIIAGSDLDPAAGLKAKAFSDPNKFEGIAPGARLINVKVGATDGAADVSQVIAAIDWVVKHRTDAGMNIRVINLSFGTASAQDPILDPLAYAAEAAWRNGIVVVAAAGNEGTTSTTLADPAYNPMIVAVGASDPHGTVGTDDDTVPRWAQHGTLRRPVDVVAPGVSVIGLRVPGSFVDSAVTTGKIGTRFQRGSGTSQATAVVSGLAALILSKFPTLNPDTVKAFLKGNALPVSMLDGYSGSSSSSPFIALLNSWYSGSGEASVASAVQATGIAVALPQVPTATGLGSLDAARGDYRVVSATTPIKGEVDIFAKPWVAATQSAAELLGSAWSGAWYNATRWYGEYDSGTWKSIEWTGTDWAGARWSGARWSGMTWDGARWSGTGWSGARWSAGTWDGARWSGARWSDAGWQ